MLSFTLSGKHTTYTYTHALILIHYKQISYFFMNSYKKFIHKLVLIANLYLFRSPVGYILVLIADLPVGHILVLIVDLYLFRSPIGVTEPILVLRYLKVLQSVYLYF